MIQIVVDDSIYTFIEHAEERMERESVTVAEVEMALLDPDRTEVNKSSGRMVYAKDFQG